MLIPPDVRARLEGLRLGGGIAARTESYGRHSGRHVGAGLEFAQYRSYEPGDELRRVDWRLYGRSDRFFVREAVRDSAQTVWVLLDTSASMAQSDASRPDFSKLRAGTILAACLADIASRQGDACGLITLGGQMNLLAAGRGAAHRERLFAALEQLECAGAWPLESQLQPLWQHIQPHSWVVMISDDFDAALPLLAERLQAARRQVLSIGIVSCEERDFLFDGGFVFREPETGELRRVDAAAERADFLSRFASARAALGRRLAACGTRHVDHVLDEPPDSPLRRLLQR